MAGEQPAVNPFLALAVTAASLALAPARAAPPAPAAPEEIAFFLGPWATEPAPVEGFETLAATPPDCAQPVRIERGPDDSIMRTARRRGGQESTVAFRVMRFAGNYPWWPVEGGPGPIARRVDADSFDLAPMAMGRADWARAIRHHRCAASSDEALNSLPDGSPHTDRASAATQP